MRNLIPIIILLFPALAMAQQGVVYPRARAGVVVPAGQYVNVFTAGIATVEKNVGGPANNLPSTLWALETNGNVNQLQPEVVFGVYANGVTLRITAFAEPVYYSISQLAVATPCLRQASMQARTQLAPVTQTVSVTALATDLLGGIVTYSNTGGSTANYTLPTGTLMDAAAGLGIGQAFSWSLINLSTGGSCTVTLVAGSGHTIVGDVLTQIAAQSTGCASSRWLTRKTAANTFVTYRQ